MIRPTKDDDKVCLFFPRPDLANLDNHYEYQTPWATPFPEVPTHHQANQSTVSGFLCDSSRNLNILNTQEDESSEDTTKDKVHWDLH